MLRTLYILFCFGCIAAVQAAGPVRIASFNPIATDLARQIGGEGVEIQGLMPPGSDPHYFRPSPDDLKQATSAQMVLVMGKHLETYSRELQATLPESAVIFELGRLVPSLRVSEEQALFACCPAHAAGAVDPHWWHDADHVRRAARELYRELARIDPEHAAGYKANYSAYAARLKQLDQWIRKEVARIPRKDRKLATAHSAFGYFCKAYGFEALPVQGLSTEEDPRPDYLREVVDTIRRDRIQAVFPEVGVNPKVLESMVRETGVRVGGSLLSGSPLPDAPTYEAMMRHNVNTIVDALAPAEKKAQP